MNESERIPATMRAAVMYDVDDIRIEERPVPALEPGDVLVRTVASGVCSGDLMPWYVRKKAPFVFGHEPAGTVVATRPADRHSPGNSRPIVVGERVFAHHHAPCFTCGECRGGRFVHCATWRGTALDPGGMAEYFRVPQANLADTLVLPHSVSFADGSLVEPLGCVVKSLRRAFGFAENRRLDEAALAGRSVYVIGAGVMGLMHVVVAAAAGATVYASDFHAGRRAAAERLGAHAAFEPETALRGLREATGGALVDATICGPGSSAALAHAVDSVANDGTVLMFTPLEPEQRFPFDQNSAYFRDVRLVASYSCGPLDTAESLRLIVQGIVSATLLEAVEFPFPDVEMAYGSMAAADVLKAIVTFPAPPNRDLDACHVRL
ncbi:MAG: alcohol dehydrogenase catalytic domain-containing protein [Candidatus Eremiobacteraeota bacterium]|nr:alcohol dehydrogenase catalytic domain-containing protein [Candidatus Eremiobacteraeota bacterium]